MNDTTSDGTCFGCGQPSCKLLSSKFDLKRLLVAATTGDEDQFKHGFETIRSARAEDRLRLQALKSSAAQTDMWPRRLYGLVPKLQAVLKAGDHKAGWAANAASSVEMRSGRRVMIASLLQGLDAYRDDQLRTFTLMNVKWLLTPHQLAKLKLPNLIRQLRTHLRRVGVFETPGPLVAFVHGEFDPVHGVFTLHFHGVTTVEKAEALMLLKGRWGYEKHHLTQSPPIRRSRITDRTRQVSYCLKPFWPSKGVRLVGGKYKRDRRGQRVPEPWHSMYLAWLSEYGISDLRVLIGCRVMPCGHLRIEG